MEYSHKVFTENQKMALQIASRIPNQTPGARDLLK